MHVALLTFSWSRKDGELIWYHDKGDCISDPVLSQMNAPSFVYFEGEVVQFSALSELQAHSCHSSCNLAFSPGV